jgi:hypothetical protein
VVTGENKACLNTHKYIVIGSLSQNIIAGSLQDLQLLDESFDTLRSSNYHLSLQISSFGLTACILDLLTKKYLVFIHLSYEGADPSSVLRNLEKRISADPILKLSYKSKSCAIVDDKATLIPDSLFDESKANKFLQFNTVINSNKVLKEEADLSKSEDLIDDQIKYDKLSILGANNIYTLPIELKQLLKKHFGAIEVFHYSSTLIETLLMMHKNKSTITLFVNFHASNFDLLLIENNSLKLYNSFCCSTKEDFVYYILFACEQLNLNPEEIHIELLGELDSKSAYYQLLYKYIRNIQFSKRNDSFTYSYKFNELPSNYFYNLFSQFQCV